MFLITFTSLADLTLSLYPDFSQLSSLVETTTGWTGLVIILAYPFLIAFTLLGVNETTLAAPLDLGLSRDMELAVIILVSGAGKAAESVSAFHIGRQTKESGYAEQAFEQLPVDVIGWIERKATQTVQNQGFVRPAAVPYMPGFPDMFSVYTFSVFEDGYLKFTTATLIDSCGRLVMTVIGIEAALVFLWLGRGANPQAS